MARKTSKPPTKEKTESTKIQDPSAGASTKEDRLTHRVPIQLLVDYRCDGHYLFDFCRDLGAGGVFIETTSPLPTGSSIDLTFTIPDSKETLRTKGKVIWVQPTIPDRSDVRAGMGVQFTKFSEEQRQTLEDFVKRHNSTKPKPNARTLQTA